MDTIIDNVLITYVTYGLVFTSGKPEVLRDVPAAFSGKEVADAKDVLSQCLDDLGGTNSKSFFFEFQKDGKCTEYSGCCG